MRIAWVLYGSLEQRTGGTIYDAEVVRGLQRTGDDVHVVSLDGDADAAVAGVALARQIEAIDPEVVVGDELCFRELAVAFRMLGQGSRGAGAARRVLLVHHLTAWETEMPLARQREVRAEEQLAIDACDAIVVTSRTTKERLVAEGGVEERTDVVVPGADRLERGRERERGRGRGRETRFVFVGAVIPRKRVVELVRAFAGAEGRLTIVGSTDRDPEYVREVRGEIATCGVGERVIMTGEVAENGVARALSDADVMVMPSSLEGYGIAATEAICAGLPVIAARAQGLEEALATCPAARIFADDEAALAAVMKRFASDAALRASMIAAAEAAAPHMPTWAECAERFRAALDR